MFCPFKIANSELAPCHKPELGYSNKRGWQCEKEQCELWIQHFGMCSLAVDADLKGQADWRAEKADETRAQA